MVSLVRLYLHLDYEKDESYTPTRIAVLSGMDEARLIEVCEVELDKPLGWIPMNLGDTGKKNALNEDVLRTWCVQIQIRENCQNGKDTHLRGLKVYGRDEDTNSGSKRGMKHREETGVSELGGMWDVEIR